MAELKLGINAGFAVNRFPEPEEWLRIVGEELGLHYVQFVADLLNPALPADIVDNMIERLCRAAERYQVKIDTTFTSTFTRVNHLMHPDQHVRAYWLNWFKDFLLIAARLEAHGAGGHFGIMSVRDLNDPERKRFIIHEAVNAWQALSCCGKELGLEFLIFEPISIPREMAATIPETEWLLEKVNESASIPIKLCLDVDHGDLNSSNPEDRDPYSWLRKFASYSPVIHIKQSLSDKGGHWPFTPEYNQQGIITPPRVIEAIEDSGAAEVILLLEISHRERHPAEYRVLSDLKESVNYWREYVPD